VDPPSDRSCPDYCKALLYNFTVGIARSSLRVSVHVDRNSYSTVISMSVPRLYLIPLPMPNTFLSSLDTRLSSDKPGWEPGARLSSTAERHDLQYSSTPVLGVRSFEIILHGALPVMIGRGRRRVALPVRKAQPPMISNPRHIRENRY
jgi:hypothetical protein